jgi:FkbM family methyltransferase
MGDGSGRRNRTAARIERGTKQLLKHHAGLYDAAATAHAIARYVRHRPHESDFHVFRHLDEPVVFADIGANRGQSALSLASVSPVKHQIVSFEANRGNERYLRLARWVLGPRFSYHLCGLGQEPDTKTFFVPCQGNRRLTGEGSFNRANVLAAGHRIDGDFRIEEENFQIRRFDSFGLEPDVVKIDVQGFELEVLNGMEDILASTAPLLLIEANPASDEPIGTFVEQFGYERYRREPARSTLVPAVSDHRPLNWFYATDATASRLPDLFDPAGRQARPTPPPAA